MGLQLSTSDKEVIVCSASIPDAFKEHAIPGASMFWSKGDYGALIFQEIAGTGFSIWYCEYLMRQTTCLYGSGEVSTLELHFTLNNDQICTLDGLGRVVVSAWQYNLTYLPFIDNKAEFKEGRNCTTFDVHFSMEYLMQLAPDIPLLGKFLEKVEKGIACSLSSHIAVASPEMIGIINSILYCEYTGTMRGIYLEMKVQELLVKGLERINTQVFTPASITLRPYDIERLQEARDWLLQNMDEPCSLVELAHKVFINEFKLKKGFKQLFGTTVFDFLLEARMEKACILLQGARTPIREIAMITGYKSIPNFTTAFKKKFGFPPSHLLKKYRVYSLLLAICTQLSGYLI